MTRIGTTLAVCLALTLPSAMPMAAEDIAEGVKITPGTAGMYADGTYDCSDKSSTYLGAIVIADLSYAFIHADGSLGNYGKLNKDDWLVAPRFFVLSGELSDRFAVVGLLLQGPVGHESEFGGETFLKAVITDEDKFLCSRRKRS